MYDRNEKQRTISTINKTRVLVMVK
jgi:hypothetical protein